MSQYGNTVTERERDKDGNFTTRVSDDEIVTFVRETKRCTTAKVADEFYDSPQGADYRLRKLKDAGRVENEKVGRTNVWHAVDGEN